MVNISVQIMTVIVLIYIDEVLSKMRPCFTDGDCQSIDQTCEFGHSKGIGKCTHIRIGPSEETVSTQFSKRRRSLSTDHIHPGMLNPKQILPLPPHLAKVVTLFERAKKPIQPNVPPPSVIQCPPPIERHAAKESVDTWSQAALDLLTKKYTDIQMDGANLTAVFQPDTGETHTWVLAIYSKSVAGEHNVPSPSHKKVAEGGYVSGFGSPKDSDAQFLTALLMHSFPEAMSNNGPYYPNELIVGVPATKLLDEATEVQSNMIEETIESTPKNITKNKTRNDQNHSKAKRPKGGKRKPKYRKRKRPLPNVIKKASPIYMTKPEITKLMSKPSILHATFRSSEPPRSHHMTSTSSDKISLTKIKSIHRSPRVDFPRKRIKREDLFADMDDEEPDIPNWRETIRLLQAANSDGVPSFDRGGHLIIARHVEDMGSLDLGGALNKLKKTLIKIFGRCAAGGRRKRSSDQLFADSRPTPNDKHQRSSTKVLEDLVNTSIQEKDIEGSDASNDDDKPDEDDLSGTTIQDSSETSTERGNSSTTRNTEEKSREEESISELLKARKSKSQKMPESKSEWPLEPMFGQQWPSSADDINQLQAEGRQHEHHRSKTKHEESIHRDSRHAKSTTSDNSPNKQHIRHRKRAMGRTNISDDIVIKGSIPASGPGSGVPKKQTVNEKAIVDDRLFSFDKLSIPANVEEVQEENTPDGTVYEEELNSNEAQRPPEIMPSPDQEVLGPSTGDDPITVRDTDQTVENKKSSFERLFDDQEINMPATSRVVEASPSDDYFIETETGPAVLVPPKINIQVIREPAIDVTAAHFFDPLSPQAEASAMFVDFGDEEVAQNIEKINDRIYSETLKPQGSINSIKEPNEIYLPRLTTRILSSGKAIEETDFLFGPRTNQNANPRIFRKRNINYAPRSSREKHGNG